MDLYEVEVWNKVDKFWDKYLVRAWSVADAKTMTRWRLNSDSQSVVFIVVNLIGFTNCTDLCQTREPFIRNTQINIRENQDTL